MRRRFSIARSIISASGVSSNAFSSASSTVSLSSFFSVSFCFRTRLPIGFCRICEAAKLFANAEDLPNFSGAGLYDTVKNVKTEKKLIEAVKTVWASLWNFEAYEARVRNYVDQHTVHMSALIQVGVNMDSGGVMFTKDPFDADNKNAIYISAVWGHNDSITANKFIPEQVLFNPKSNAVQVLTLTQQNTVIKFDEGGDLAESDETVKRRVLNDKNVRELVKTANNIKRVFGGKKEQDIEWGIMNGKIYIVQARPYVDKW